MKQNKYLYFWDFVIIYKKDIKVKNLLIFRYWKGEKNKYDRREGHLFIKCAIQWYLLIVRLEKLTIGLLKCVFL